MLVEIGGHESSRYLVGSKPSAGGLRDRLALVVRGVWNGPPGNLVLTAAVVITVRSDTFSHTLRGGTITGERGNERTRAVNVNLLKRASLVSDGDVGAKWQKGNSPSRVRGP